MHCDSSLPPFFAWITLLEQTRREQLLPRPTLPQALRHVWEHDAQSRKALAHRAHTLKACLLQSNAVLRQAKQGERWGAAAWCCAALDDVTWSQQAPVAAHGQHAAVHQLSFSLAQCL